ncbi:MAG: 4-hydroxy-tetrahydrodipicolinate reductase [Propionibacteriaceae bacterium]|jgi:4-hydroxy-tetrahydrodipicolinate reductase|nr:4-hydroxy-tetrahydrodipicolinate reductase [Propionibacteriaceae bacterium]
MLRIVVFGANGRMGAEVCQTLGAQPDCQIVAAIDLGDPKDDLVEADVAVDFTHPDAVMDNIAWCLERGINAVVGTTGFTPERLDQVTAMLGSDPTAGVLIAPNFSIGAVLMMHFAAVAAPYFESVEIIEAHHTAKADAPSGTAATTASMVAAARAAAATPAMVDATTHETPGARGAQIEGVRVHSLRLPGVIAQQEVRLASAGETLTVVNDARSRASYMPGVLQGVRWIMNHPGLTVGLETVLGIS